MKISAIGPSRRLLIALSPCLVLTATVTSSVSARGLSISGTQIAPRCLSRCIPWLPLRVKAGCGRPWPRSRGLSVSVSNSIQTPSADVLATNRAADTILKAAEGPKSHAGRLACDRPEDSCALATAICAVAKPSRHRKPVSTADGVGFKSAADGPRDCDENSGAHAPDSHGNRNRGIPIRTLLSGQRPLGC
jgi:hypothetical protein